MKKLIIALFVMLLSLSCLFACDLGTTPGGGGDTTEEECTHGGGWATCTKKAVCNLCGEEYGELNPDNHFPGETWLSSGDKHYRMCSNGCGTMLDEGDHTGGVATCQSYAQCTVCGEEYGSYDDDNHKASTEWTSVNGAHYHACEYGCYKKFDYAKCDGEATCVTPAICSVCGGTHGEEDGGHSPSDKWTTEDGVHYHECLNGCGTKLDEATCDGTATCASAAICTVCNVEHGEKDPENHVPSEEWITENGVHYRTCKTGCDVKLDEAECDGTANCTSAAICTVCGVAHGEKDLSNHVPAPEWITENGVHYHVCIGGCDGRFDEAACDGTATCASAAVCTVCNVEHGEKNPDNHVPTAEWTTENGVHYHTCTTGCDIKLDEAACDGTATCASAAVCTVCGVEHGEKNPDNHAPSSAWTAESGKHYHACLNCGTKLDEGEHEMSEWKDNGDGNVISTCAVCGFKKTEASIVEILPAKDGASGIVSIIHDDARATTGVLLDGLLVKYNLIADVAALTKNLYDHSSGSTKEAYHHWKAIVETGRWGVISHSVNHAWWGTVTKDSSGANTNWEASEEKMILEIVTSQEILRNLFPGQRVLSFVYPGFSSEKKGLNSKQVMEIIYSEAARDLVNQYYIAGADSTGGAHSIVDEELDWTFVPRRFLSTSNINATDSSGLEAQIQKIINENGMLALSIHGLVDADTSDDSYYLPLPDMDKAMTMVKKYVDAGQIWNAHHDEAILYVREAQNATFSIAKGEAAYTLTLSLPAEMSTEIYNYPITARVEVPTEWAAVKITHGNDVSYAVAKPVGDKWVIDANVVPSGIGATIEPVAIADIPAVEKPEVMPTPDLDKITEEISKNGIFSTDFENGSPIKESEKGKVVDLGNNGGKVFQLLDNSTSYQTVTFPMPTAINAEAIEFSAKIYVNGDASSASTLFSFFFNKKDASSPMRLNIMKGSGGFYFKAHNSAGTKATATSVLAFDTWHSIKIVITLGKTSDFKAEFMLLNSETGNYESIGTSTLYYATDANDSTMVINTVDAFMVGMLKSALSKTYIDDLTLKAGTYKYIGVDEPGSLRYEQDFNTTEPETLPSLDVSDTYGTAFAGVILPYDEPDQVYMINDQHTKYKSLKFPLTATVAEAIEFKFKINVDGSSISATDNPMIRMFFGAEDANPYDPEIYKGTNGFTFGDRRVGNAVKNNAVTEELAYDTWHDIKIVIRLGDTESFYAEYFLLDGEEYRSIGRSTNYASLQANTAEVSNTVSYLLLGLYSSTKITLYLDDISIRAGSYEYIGVDAPPEKEKVYYTHQLSDGTLIDVNYYPSFVRKAITFTMDDGNLTYDRIFAEKIAGSSLKGTYNIKPSATDTAALAEMLTLYAGHEVANHHQLHCLPFREPTKNTTQAFFDLVIDEQFNRTTALPEHIYKTNIEGLYYINYHYYSNSYVNSDGTIKISWHAVATDETYKKYEAITKETIEGTFGEGSVVGFAYPHGVYTETIKQHLIDAGYLYARNTGNLKATTGFALPADRFCWTYNADVKCLLEVAAQYEAYPEDGQLKFFAFGVHPKDFADYKDADGNNLGWGILEEYVENYGSRNNTYWYATNRQIFEYEDAVKALIVTDDGITNNSDIDCYVKINGEKVVIEANSTYTFN